MSLFGNMVDRGRGELIKKEDELQNVWEFSDPIDSIRPQPITFVGKFNGFPDAPISGQLYYVEDDATIDGVKYNKGEMLLYDGTYWHVINQYSHQVLDIINQFQGDSRF